MEQNDFNSLSIDEQADLIWGPNGKGKFLESQSEYGKCRIALYILGDMIVSVHYDLDANKIRRIKAWKKGADRNTVMGNISMN